jgi:hypothetical protein
MKTVLLAAAIIFCSSTYAADTTASELLSNCSGRSIKECKSFVEGAVSGIRAEQANKMGVLRGIYASLVGAKDATSIKVAFGSIPSLCMNPDVATESVVQVIIDYAKSTPQDSNATAGWLVFDALQNKYGCNVQF